MDSAFRRNDDNVVAIDENRVAGHSFTKNRMLLGAHVSTAGGIRLAPERGAAIGASAIQIFTKMPSRWAEKPVSDEEAQAFVAARRSARILFACSHDSYLINLATADPILRDRSYESFRMELERSRDLGLDAVVTHPGNATDGDFSRGLQQNASLIARAIEAVLSPPRVLLETTAGSGQVLGSTFEEIASIRLAIPAHLRARVGVCLDTCHVFSAGYDLRDDYDSVFDRFDQIIGLEHLSLFHLNDSQRPLGSRRDRHAGIGEGSLGTGTFERIMTDPRFADIPKVIETPKGDDPVVTDSRNLRLLRSFAMPQKARVDGDSRE